MSEEEHKYHVKIELVSEREGKLLLDDKNKPVVHIATPPEFPGGKPGIISPEDLFVGAVISCKMTTFYSMAEKLDIGLKTLLVEATGYLGKAEILQENARGLAFTKMTVHMVVGIGDEANRKSTEKCIDLTEKYCLVTNSIKTPIQLTFEINIV